MRQRVPLSRWFLCPLLRGFFCKFLLAWCIMPNMSVVFYIEQKATFSVPVEACKATYLDDPDCKEKFDRQVFPHVISALNAANIHRCLQSLTIADIEQLIIGENICVETIRFEYSETDLAELNLDGLFEEGEPVMDETMPLSDMIAEVS